MNELRAALLAKLEEARQFILSINIDHNDIVSERNLERAEDAVVDALRTLAAHLSQSEPQPVHQKDPDSTKPEEAFCVACGNPWPCKYASQSEPQGLPDGLKAFICERGHNSSAYMKSGDVWRVAEYLTHIFAAPADGGLAQTLIDHLREDTCSEDDEGVPFYDASLADNIIRAALSSVPTPTGGGLRAAPEVVREMEMQGEKLAVYWAKRIRAALSSLPATPEGAQEVKP